MLKFLLIVLIVFFVLRIIGRMFVVGTFNSLNRKVEEEMKRRSPYNTPPKPEGHITIDKDAKGKNRNDGDGEYTDYEEIK